MNTTGALHQLAELRRGQQSRELRDTYRYVRMVLGIAMGILSRG